MAPTGSAEGPARVREREETVAAEDILASFEAVLPMGVTDEGRDLGDWHEAALSGGDHDQDAEAGSGPSRSEGGRR
jgi:hypothetical protein